MNHGGLGYLSYRRLVVPVDLLRPLSVGDGSRLLGMYYPPKDEPEYKQVPRCHDLMLTPVPLRYWPVMGRFLLRLRHRAGTLAKVATWLDERKVSILNAECSRSAHRYATWNLTVAFDALVDVDNPFDPTTSEHIETRKAVSALVRDLDAEFPGPEVLFRDARDRGLARAIEGVPIRTHSYFYERLAKSDAWQRPFELHCWNNQLRSSDEALGALLNRLEESGTDIAPTCVVAEMDTRDFNIRVAILLPEDLPRFFEVVIPYRRFGGGSTRGLLAAVARHLEPRYNVWRVFNSTSQNGELVEAGEAAFVLEDQNEKLADRQRLRQSLARSIAALRDEFESIGPRATKILPHWRIEAITPDWIRERLIRDTIRDTGLKYDVFISYGKRDGKRSARSVRDALEAQGLHTHLDEDAVKPGEDWHKRLIQGVRESREVAVICTRRSMDRPWVAFEIGCARGLGRTVTPIICSDIDDADVPDYLKRFQWVVRRKDRKLEEYARSVFERRARTTR